MKYSANQVKNNLGQVQKTLNWAMTMIKSASGVGAFDSALVTRIQTTSLPTPDVQLTPVELGGHSFNSLGKVTKRGMIQGNVVEGTDAKFTNYMIAYSNAMWSGDGTDTTGNQKTDEELKCDLQLDLMDGENKVTQSFIMVGCIITPQFNSQLGQSSENYLIGLKIDYDDFHLKTPGASW